MNENINKKTICFNTKLTWQNIARVYNNEAESYHMSISTAFVLLHLSEKEGTQITTIAPLLGMEATSLSRILNNLEAKGLIYRKRGTQIDKRAVLMFLTEEGKDARYIAKEKVKRFNSVIRENIAEEKLQVFFEVMDEINKVIDTQTIF